MPNARVFATVEGSGEALTINVNAAGTFTLSKGRPPVGANVVPVTCDIIGSGTDFTISRAANNSHSPNIRKPPIGNRSVVPILGTADGPIKSININASTGAITAGARSTTVAALFT